MRVKYSVKVSTGFIWLSIGAAAGCFEYGDDPLGAVRAREFLTK
jgi:hypothetical protein